MRSKSEILTPLFFVLLVLAPLSAARGTMRCTPKTLQSNEVLVISMDVPHGAELAAFDPKGEQYYVSFLPVPGGGRDAPAIRPNLFRDVAELRISPLTFQGWHYRYGAERWTSVFSMEGEYEFRLSESLSGDNPNVRVDSCKVNYVSTRQSRGGDAGDATLGNASD